MNFEYTYVFITMKILNLLWKHLLPIIKRLILKSSYVCPIWIFIFDTAQAQINSVLCWVELTTDPSSQLCCHRKGAWS
jgi:hypothetical protein